MTAKTNRRNTARGLVRAAAEIQAITPALGELTRAEYTELATMSTRLLELARKVFAIEQRAGVSAAAELEPG